MKTIKANISLLNLIIYFLLAFCITSCSKDDVTTSKDDVTTPPKTVSFIDSEYILESSGTAFNLPIQINSSGFNSDYIVKYTINGNEVLENITASQVPQLQIDISQLGRYDVELISISTSDSQIGEIDQTNKTTRIYVASGRDSNGLKLFLLWEDTINNDLDFFVTDGGVTSIVDSSQGVLSNSEIITLPNAEPDAEYRVFIRNYQSVIDNIPYTILTTSPNGTINMFNGEVPNVSFQFNEVLKVQKLGSLYTFTHLVPSVPL
ncbi:hypothetical protein JYT89_04220 [Flavobacteriaceae bacterium AH-315-B10]|nr:hypothetical protein [Flavobacteriaceae bacterium AH-315-B10]